MRFVLICLSHLFLPVFIIKVEVYCILDRQYFQNTAVIYGLTILSSVFLYHNGMCHPTIMLGILLCLRSVKIFLILLQILLFLF
jgi:hypothetical protein